MKKVLLLALVAIAALDRALAQNNGCSYDGVTCEWKYTTFQWSCPVGQSPVARAFWGRDAGDNTTCVDQVPSTYLQNLNCPGDDAKASAAVTAWCSNNVQADGKCRIRASYKKLLVDGNEHDPCVGTFKYLRVCRYCSTPAPDLKLAAFKVTTFGVSKMNDPAERPHIITIFSRYDVVVMQDIRDASQQSLPELVTALTASTGETWDFVASDRLGRSSSKMQYAFVFRSDKVQVAQTYQFPDTADLFEREPFGALLKAPKTAIGEFAVMAVDAKPSTAEVEVDGYVDVYAAMATVLGTENILIAGNMDADCTYIRASEWPSVRLRHDARFSWLIGDDVDTTATTTNCAYDRFVVRKGALESAIVPGSVDIYKFDAALGLTPSQATSLSYHYPIELDIKGKIGI